MGIREEMKLHHQRKQKLFYDVYPTYKYKENELISLKITPLANLIHLSLKIPLGNCFG